MRLQKTYKVEELIFNPLAMVNWHASCHTANERGQVSCSGADWMSNIRSKKEAVARLKDATEHIKRFESASLR